MRLSIVIPTFNEAHGIEAAVERAWQLGPLEVLVSDGGSTDSTPQIARRLRCQFIEGSAGRAAQQNRAAALAQGEVLLFLHADTWLPAAARDQLQQALADPGVEAGAFRQHIDAAPVVYRWLEWGNAARVRWGGPAYGDQGLFVRRSVFEALGGFPPVRLLEDLLLSRALARRARLALLPGPLQVSPRRWQARGVVRQTLRNWGILLAHRLGVSPDRLAGYYPRHE